MLAKRLAALRKLNKKTQDDMAKLLGITRPAYTAYEAGRRNPDYETLQKIADYFNVSIDYLLGRTDHPKGIVLQGKTEEEKRKIYQEFVIGKANEPLKYKGK